MKTTTISVLAILACIPMTGLQAGPIPPLKVLLVTGGCCHDYKTQKDLLEAGLEARVNLEITQAHSPDSNTKPRLPIFGNPDYAKDFDLVIHDECAADITDLNLIEGVLKPHREDGIPAVNLHCAMHSYRFGNFQKPVAEGAANSHWYEFIGLQSSRHGPKTPIFIRFTDKDSPITKGMADWRTIEEELYNNVRIISAKPLASGTQMQASKGGNKPVEAESVVVWTNLYGPRKTRVFSTTIGHQNETVADSRYLDLVARGVLWATGHLNDDGSPAAGYGPAGK